MDSFTATENKSIESTTVAGLIELLKTYDQDLPVQVHGWDGYCHARLTFTMVDLGANCKRTLFITGEPF